MTTVATEPPEPAAAPPPPPDERLAYRGPIQRLLTRPEIGALIGAAVIWIFFWGVSDVFGTVAGANNYLDVAAGLGIMSVAVAMLMIGGEFDLSAGAMTGATGMLVVLLVKETGEFGGAGLPLIVAIPITLAFAVGVGWTNGTLVEKTALPSFIITLGTFFVLRGAKLGFAKLFTDKVIVEGLDDGAGFAFFKKWFFGGVWIRNSHQWETFLGGRDVVFAVLVVAGAALIGLGLLELSFERRPDLQQSGIAIALVGAAAAIVGLTALTETDATSANWIWSAVMGAGIVVALFGVGKWRYREVAEQGSMHISRKTIEYTAGGIALMVAGVVIGLVLDSESQTEVGFLLTVQGLRAIAFAGLSIAGLVLLILAAREAGKASHLSRFLITTVAAAAIVAIAFIVQSEADHRKFRAELFTWFLLAALIMFGAGLLRLFFVLRQRPEAAADKLGRILSVTGIVLVTAGICVRLMWSIQVENDASPAVITFRVSVLYFFLFAGVATWVLLRTKFGSWVFASGGNAPAARQVGVPVARTKTTLFIIVSVSAWVVGMLIAFRLNSVQANVGDGQEFFYIIAAVVGGNLLTGGYGSAAGAAIGALIMAMSFQGIPFSGWNSDWRFLFVGVILLLAVLVNRYVRTKAEAS